MQHFTRFQLTVGSHGSSALTELLVNLPFNHRDLYYRGYLKKY